MTTPEGIKKVITGTVWAAPEILNTVHTASATVDYSHVGTDPEDSLGKQNCDVRDGVCEF